MDKKTEIILNKIYNLILDKDIHENEREILLSYKTKLENTKNKQRVVMELAEVFRQQAVSGIHSNKSLSPKIAIFYKEIATYGQLSKNIAQGLISLGIIR